jgi:hypothetical protein
MKEIVSDAGLVAYCGLYCGACKRYLREKCPGCHEHEKAGWCGVRTCCRDHRYSSCAECGEFADPRACSKFNNIVAKAFALLFRSDRAACIGQIRELGIQGHADRMSGLKLQSLKRGSRSV